MPRQDIAVELYYDGAWHDLVTADDVFADTPIVIMRGDGDESAALRPSSITLRLANDDDMYRTSNPESPLYGKAGVNTPLRVLVGGVARGIGEVSSWRCGQTRDFRRTPARGKAWVDIEANGLSQRVNQWSDLVESTMVKGMKSFTDDLIGIWPLEDESSSTILSQLVPGGTSGAFTGDVTLGDSERPAGSARSAKLGTAGRMAGTFITSSASGWQISFAVRLAAIPGSATPQEIFTCTDSLGRRWAWEVTDTRYGWVVYDSDGVVLSSLASAAFTDTEPNQWIRFLLKVTVSGGTITYQSTRNREGVSTLVSNSNTFAGTSTGTLRTWAIEEDAYNVGAWYTGVFAVDDPTVSVFNTGVIADFNGHAGETAGDRFVRLLTDAGLSASTNGDLALSTAMGGQPVATLAELLREIRDTDDAILFESKSVINFVLTLRDSRTNQTPALTLDASDPTSGLPNLPVEVTDDLPIHNVVTAAQRSGGEYTAEDSTSPMGSQPPPAGRGEYRQTVDVNVADEATDLPVQAVWWLRRGTVNQPRFPRVTVNLATLDAAKVAEVEAATIGSVIEITGYREYTIRLHVLGYTETIGWPNARTITFTCAPDQQFDMGTYDGDRRYDLRTATMAAAAGPTATTLTLAITADEAWSRTSAYDLMIAGERVGAPVGGMGARSGSAGAYTQTLTGAVRSKNGIRKTLPAASEVHVATPGRWAR